MAESFLKALSAFVGTEGIRDRKLTQAMGLLSGALTRLTPADEESARISQPVVDRHLNDALSAGVGTPVDLIRSVVGSVSWIVPYPEYAGEPDMDAMRASYAFAPLIAAGKDSFKDDAVSAVSGPYLSDEVFVGLVLQGPNCDYPSHVHKSEEVFWVASGTADWQRGDDWRVEEPGGVIHHASGVRHATVTRHEPLLMLFAWVTDPHCTPVVVRH
ncbi:MAG: dimethylsulfonioproprionate lyase family protein [Acidimicrobiales bacterium]|nr:dimethylsulfonioproprionate lyase family protein [Acidimicrobiales bacterium]